MSKSVAIIGTRGYPSYYGGFETAVRRLAPFLCDTGWDVTVYGRPNATNERDPLRDHRVRSVVTSGVETSSLSTLSFGLSAARDAKRRRPDVALVMNVANGFWLPILRRAGIPTVVNVDGIEWERAKWGRTAKAVFRQGARMTAKYADALIADSTAIAARWRDEFHRESSFIPYGADAPPILPVPLGLQHRGYILIVARFVPENTVAEFFEAVEDLASRHKIVIVGSSGYGGPLDQRAASLSSEHENVIWVGHVRDDDLLFSLWQHAGAYFHGHSVGGTNPALVQAMACGAPIVARDTVYNREVLGDNASLVAPNAGAITDAMDVAMARAANFVPEPIKERAAQHYAWEDVCGAYSALLDSTAGLRGHELKKLASKSGR